MNRKAALLAGVAFAAGLIGLSPYASAQEIGDVAQRSYRGAIGTPPGEGTRNLYYGNLVYANETIETGNEGSTVLRFADATELRLGSNATVVLDQFVYDPATKDGQAVFTLSKGVMRFISGDMDKDGYSIRTPTATMAVRGTDFTVWMVQTTGATIVSVISGAIEVLDCGDHQFVASADQAFRVRGDCSGADRLPPDYTPPPTPGPPGGGDRDPGPNNRPGAGKLVGGGDEGGGEGGEGGY